MPGLSMIRRLRFARSEGGSLSVEAMIAFPLLIWAMAALFVFYDAYKTRNVSQRATYTIADMLSREEDPVDVAYIEEVHELFGYLTQEYEGSKLRVTVVQLVKDPDTEIETLELIWSEPIGGLEDYTDLTELDGRVPMMAPGDQMIVVQTYQDWVPPMAIGLTAMTFEELSITRPRYAPQLVWDDGSAGAV